MGIAAIMGALYGLFGGLFLKPALVSVMIVGIFVAINFVFALLSVLPNVIVQFLRKKEVRLTRYFTFSLAFFLVFFPYFVLLKLVPVTLF